MIMDKIELLNTMQKEAVLKVDGPLLVLAGAGSGKTRVLTHRIAYLIEQGVSPFNILAITFTNKAAKEMKERVEQITPYGNEVWVSTFHSTCVRILRREIHNLGYSNQFTIYDPDDCERLLKEIYKNNSINEKNLPYKYMLSEISSQKDKLIDANKYETENYSNFKKKDSILIYKEYEKILKSNNALDFDDLIFKTVNLFSQNQEVLDRYQKRFKYIMVDEYQDTSLSQYTLVKLLAGKFKNICVVGDDDQSIYGWRGADIKNILNFENDFEGTKVIKLEQNYRSTKNILDAANFVIKNNFGRKQKSLWTENKRGEAIKFNRCESDKAEALFIANEIKARSKNKYSDFSILYRNNSISRIIEEQLVYLGIPYTIYGGVNFYGRKEIKDVIAYLRVLYNSNDDISLKRIINVPKRNIGSTTIDKLNQYAFEEGCSFFETLKNAEKVPSINSKANNILKFYYLIEDFKKYSEENKISDTIKHILEKTGYVLDLEKEMTEEANSRIENINELINKAIEFESVEEEATLARFLEEISLVSSIDINEDDPNKVTLMTLHSAKGLEFPVVFIVGFEEGIFPSYRAIVSPDATAIEEERRLCYVGITRAKEELFITCAKSRLQQGRYDNNLPSRFIEEIPDNYVLNLSLSSKPSSSFIKKELGTYRPKSKYISSLNSSVNREMPSPKNFKIDFKEGDSIRHFKFGIGKVEKVEPAGADYEVTVIFEDAGTKKLMAKLSKLQKI